MVSRYLLERINLLYDQLFNKISEIYGHEDRYHPIRNDRFSLATSLKKLSTEIRVHTAFQPRRKRWWYAVQLKVLTTIGR